MCRIETTRREICSRIAGRKIEGRATSILAQTDPTPDVSTKSPFTQNKNISSGSILPSTPREGSLTHGCRLAPPWRAIPARPPAPPRLLEETAHRPKRPRHRPPDAPEKPAKRKMARGVGVFQRVVQNIAIAIEGLRIEGVRHNGVGGEKPAQHGVVASKSLLMPGPPFDFAWPFSG